MKKPFLIVSFLYHAVLMPAAAQDYEHRRSSASVSPGTHADTQTINTVIREAGKISMKQPDSAVALLREALLQSREQGYPDGAMAALRITGDILSRKGSNDSAQISYNHAVQFVREPGASTRQVILIYRNIARSNLLMGKHQEAFLYIYKALTLVHNPSIEADIKSGVYQIMAILMMAAISPYQQDPGQLADAVMYYNNLAAYWAKEAGNKLRSAEVLTNNGVILRMRGKKELSRRYFSVALTNARQLESPYLEFLALINLARLYIDQDQIETAMTYLRQATPLLDKAPPNNQVDYYLHYATVLMERKQYKQAEKELLKVIGLAEDFSLKYILSELHRLLSVCYEHTGRYREAIQYYRMSVEAQQKFISKNELEKFRQMELKYRTLEQEKDIYRKQLMITEQRRKIASKNRVIGGSFAGMAVLSAVIFIGYRSFRNRKKLQEKQLRILRQDQEIGQLKAMMNGEEKERRRIARELHDGIGGMLTTVRLYLDTMKIDNPSLAPAGHLSKALLLLEGTAEEVRKTAHNLMPDILIRHNLQKALETYCDSINATGQLRIDFRSYNLPPDIGKATELMLYRMIQELILNIIKHARATRAEIQIMDHDGTLTILVEDNGIGFDTEAPHEGFGLEHLKFRVQALQGFISVTSVKGKNTTVHIEFNIEKLKLADTV